MSSKAMNRFGPYGLWLLANAAGFLAGSLLGATDGGYVPEQLLATWGRWGLIAGDLVFGACIGLAQWWALRRTAQRSLSLTWIPVTALGFVLGARLGPGVSFAIAADVTLIAIVFGVVMGGAQGVATWFLVRDWHPRAGLWIPFSIAAWVVGESIAFSLGFAHWGVPLVAVAIAAVTGAHLFGLRSRSAAA